MSSNKPASLVGFFAFIVLLFGVGTCSASAEELSPEERKTLSEKVKQLERESKRLGNEGDPAGSFRKLHEAYKLRQRLFPKSKFPKGHHSLAHALNVMAVRLQAMGSYEQAQQFGEASLRMNERLYPKEKHPNGNPSIAANLVNLGYLLQTMGKLERAEAYSQRAVQMCEQLYPQDKFPRGHFIFANGLNALGLVFQEAGELQKALPILQRSLAMQRRLYPESKFPQGHPDLATSLNNMGSLLSNMGELRKSLECHRESLQMNERLFPSRRFPRGHPILAESFNNLGVVYEKMADYDKAFSFFQRAHQMQKTLYPKKQYPHGHPSLVASYNNLAYLLEAMGQAVKAQSFGQQAIQLCERLYPEKDYPRGHPSWATTLDNFGLILQDLAEFERAKPYHKQALQMCERLYPKEEYPQGHSHLAGCYNNMGMLLANLKDYDGALSFLQKAVQINEHLYPPTKYPRGHIDHASSLLNLGTLMSRRNEYKKAMTFAQRSARMYEQLYPSDQFPHGHLDRIVALELMGVLLLQQGQSDEALEYLERALHMQRRQIDDAVVGTPEGQALARLAARSSTRDAYLSASLQAPIEKDHVYEVVWLHKGAVFRLLRRRHEDADIARLQSEEVRTKWDRLREVRAAISRLFVTPTNNLVDRDRRLAKFQQEQEQLERQIGGLLEELRTTARATQLPSFEKAKRLAQMTPMALQERLPTGSVFLDFVVFEQIREGEPTRRHFGVFVLAKDHAIRFLDLGRVGPIEQTVAAWGSSMLKSEPTTAPHRLRQMLWDELAESLPAETRTVYLCPTLTIGIVPWSALPGSKPDTILLEDYAFASVPSPQWLLEQLAFPSKPTEEKATILAMGGVEYGPQKTKRAYPPLPETRREYQRVRESFAPNDRGITGSEATAENLKTRLAQVRYAHLATHGYFDTDSFQSEFQRLVAYQSQTDFARERNRTVSVRLQNPLGFVGLACANANDPEKPGILTGLDIVELPLGRMRLCVLSACETGVGVSRYGEGTEGLQRAFHIAGCPNVIGSLWNVNDAATAALMSQFYHELRVNKRPPIEALREAQLTIYRHPERITALAGDRGRPALEKAVKLGSTTAKPTSGDKRTPTKLWAAFVLSGVGR